MESLLWRNICITIASLWTIHGVFRHSRPAEGIRSSSTPFIQRLQHLHRQAVTNRLWNELQIDGFAVDIGGKSFRLRQIPRPKAPSLPTKGNDEIKPFIRRLPEFKFWYALTKAVCIAFVMTFFSIFDVPIFWPILLLYWIVLFVLTMKRQKEDRCRSTR